MSGYLELADQRVFVEEYGAGEPLFLLHGGMVAADSWQFQIAALAERYQVFVPERRGHGRTPDVPGPYTTEDMAAETVAVIEALVDGPVRLVGWSDGAYVAAYAALTRPDLVTDKHVSHGTGPATGGARAVSPGHAAPGQPAAAGPTTRTLSGGRRALTAL